MAAARFIVSLAVMVTLFAGCGLSQKTQIGRNTTIENSFPNGYPNAKAKSETQTIRAQSPSDPIIKPGTLEQAAASIPLKKNEAQVRVVATVGTDTIITDEEVWHMVKQKPEQYAMLMGNERTAKEHDMFRAELKLLIAREMIIADFMAKAKKNNPNAVEEVKQLCIKESERSMRVLKNHLKAKSDEDFLRILNELGVTDVAMKRQYERNVMVDLFVSPTIRERVKAIGIAEMREYYESHPDEFSTANRAKWLYATVLTSRFKSADEAKQYADWISNEAAKGTDFVELVKKYGMGDSSLRGGEGIGEKPGEVKPAELDATIFSMTKANQVSKPIPYQAGYHIVKILERDLPGLKPFDEKVQAECRARLANQIQKKEIDRLTDDLWRKYNPQIFDIVK